MRKRVSEILVRPFFWLFLLVALAVSVYSNSFGGVFLLDDYPNILEHEKVHSLAWPWEFMLNVRRPLLYLSLAVNYALGGTNPLGYHFFNLAVHVLCGLTVWAIVRQSWVLLPGGKERASSGAADGVATLVAALWLVHPLQTESVTYIVQRTESLMALFYCLSWYSAIRYFLSRKIRWAFWSGLAAVLSGVSKEVAVTIPVLILLYDRAYFSRGFRDALVTHRWLYLALLPLWGVMAYLWFFTQPEIIATAGFALKGTTWLQYAATQPGVILQYLRLIFWPHPLVFDYGWPMTLNPAQIIVPLLLLWGLLSATVSLYLRRPQLGFWALLFFVILLPSSSVIPLRDPIFEHRVYLSLLGPVVLAVWVLWSWAAPSVSTKRFAATAVAGVMLVGVLGFLTFQRNKDYGSEMGMWRDVLNKRPSNARAWNNYGRFLADAGQKDAAIAHYQRAIELDADYADAYLNLGSVLVEKGQYEQAKIYTQKAFELNPLDGVAYNNYGGILMNEEQYAAAVPYFEQALGLGFQEAGVYHNLGLAYAKTSQPYKAVENIQSALRLNPLWPQAREHLAEVLAKMKALGMALP